MDNSMIGRIFGHHEKFTSESITRRINQHAKNVTGDAIPPGKAETIKSGLIGSTAFKFGLLGLPKLLNKISHHWNEWSSAQKTAAVFGVIGLSIGNALFAWTLGGPFALALAGAFVGSTKRNVPQKIEKEFYEQEVTGTLKDLHRAKRKGMEVDKKEIYDRLIEIKKNLEEKYPDKEKLMGDKILGIEPKWWYKKLEAAIKEYKT